MKIKIILTDMVQSVMQRIYCLYRDEGKCLLLGHAQPIKAYSDQTAPIGFAIDASRRHQG